MFQLPHFVESSKGSPTNILKSKYFIIDTDGGADDLYAIMTAIYCSQKYGGEILDHRGEVPVKVAVNNVLSCLAVVGSKIPVYAGCEQPISTTSWSDKLFGEDGMSGHSQHYAEKLQLAQVHEQHAVQFIIDSVIKYQNDIAIIVIGAATNLGLAVVKDHRIEHLINNVFFYGGNIYGIDRNVSLDVDAIHLVNKAFTERLIVVPHETALRTLTKINRGEFIELAYEVVTKEYEYQETTSALAVIAAFVPESVICHTTRKCTVVLQGEARGMIVINWRGKHPIEHGGDTTFTLGFNEPLVFEILSHIH